MDGKKSKLFYEEEMACIGDDESDNPFRIPRLKHAVEILTEYYVLPSGRKFLVRVDELH